MSAPGTPPDQLTPAERLDEVAQILAAGILRWRTRQLARHTADEPVGPEQVRLDFAPAPSMHAAPLRSRRERP